MLRNYLNVAVRTLRRHKVHASINIAGLAVGMACCILILLFVQDEFSYDGFHENGERVYRVIRRIRADDGAVSYSPITPGPLAASLRDEFPEVEQAVRLWSWAVWVKHGDVWSSEHARVVDGNTLEILTFPLISGNREAALRDPYSIVISDEMATKYLGDEDPMGKSLIIDRGSLSGEYKVTGVWDSSVNSAVSSDCLIATVPEAIRSYWDGWESRPFFETFVVLRTDQDPLELERKFPDFIARHMGAENTEFHLQPLSRIHLYSNADFNGMEPWRGDNIAYVYQLLTVGLLIMAVASVNFVFPAGYDDVVSTQDRGDKCSAWERAVFELAS